MVDRNDTLMREVDEELRRERFEKLWKQYGSYILLAAAAFVAMVGGYKLWEARTLEAAQKAGASLVDARNLITENKTEEGRKALEALSKSGSAGVASLARLETASADMKAGKTAEALAAFEGVAKDAGADPILRDFAALQAAAIRLPDADWTEMQNRLNPLAGEKSPWRASARELIGYAQLKAQKPEDARNTFTLLLGDRNTPPGVAERVKIAMARIVADELAKAPAPAAAAPASAPSAAKDGKADAKK